MDKVKIEDYLKKLKEIDSRLNNENEYDDGVFDDINEIIKNLDVDFKNDVVSNDDLYLKVKVKKLNKAAVIPEYAKLGDAGLDLTITRIIDETEEKIVYGTDLSLEIPLGYVGLVFPRSSIRKYQLSLTNCVGVIDCVPKGTKIKTINGEISVEELFENPSTPIFSYNEEKNKIEVDYITDMWIVENKELLKITTEDGDEIDVPLEKEVFTKSGWKKVKNLCENDEILRFF